MWVQTIAEGNNYTAVNIGTFNELKEHVIKTPNLEIQGKIFLHDLVHLTGSEISYTYIPAGEQLPFFHSHKNNEEVYLIIHGNGEFQINDKVFPIQEGSVIRIGTNASRCYKNTGTEPLIIICIQTKEYKE